MAVKLRPQRDLNSALRVSKERLRHHQKMLKLSNKIIKDSLSQIDQDRSDYISLMLVPMEEWEI